MNSEITSTSRQRETEVLDGESRWGEPEDDTQQKGNENTEKATKTAMRTFEQWRSDTKQDTNLPCAPLSKTSRPTFRCPALLWLRAFLSCRPPRPSIEVDSRLLTLSRLLRPFFLRSRQSLDSFFENRPTVDSW